MEMFDMTAAELGKRIQAGEITAVEAAEYSLSRIKEKDGQINAFITVEEEKVMENARRVQQKIERRELTGPLAGVPVAVKDNICTEGLRTTCAFDDFGYLEISEPALPFRNGGRKAVLP